MTPDRDTIDWILSSSRWWIESFGGFVELRETSIVLPTEDDFPVDVDLDGHALAEDYFAFVVEHARLADWPLVLLEQGTPNVADALRGMPHHMTSAPRSTETEKPPPIAAGDPLPIPYDASQLGDPAALVATMARGASHYLLYAAPTEAPGEPDEHEYFVDLGAVLLGFGVFLANSAFHFQQSQSGSMIGWGFSTRGALSQLSVSYALALVATLLDVPDRDVLPHLKTNPSVYFKSARKHLTKRRRAELDRLRAIPPLAGDGPYR